MMRMNGIEHAGDITINTYRGILGENSKTFRVIDDNCDIFPTNNGFGMRIRSSSENSYDLWLMSNDTTVWFCKTVDGEYPTSPSDWKTFATTDYAVNKAGDTMTGTLFIDSKTVNDKGNRTISSFINQQAQTILRNAADTDNFQDLQLSSTGAFYKGAEDGVHFNYKLLHEGNKNLITAEDTGAAPKAHNHKAAEITGGILGVNRGGTGISSNPSMLINLESTDAASVFTASPKPGITGKLGLDHGGTGAATAAEALSNLGAAPAGFGLGTAAKAISNTDLLDTLTTGKSGWYRGTNVTNAPVTSWCYFEIISDSADYSIVNAYPFSGGAYRALYEKGSLLSWTRHYDSGNKPKLSDLGVTASATELNYVDGVTSSIQTQFTNSAKCYTALGRINEDLPDLITYGGEKTDDDVDDSYFNNNLLEIYKAMPNQSTAWLLASSSTSYIVAIRNLYWSMRAKLKKDLGSSMTANRYMKISKAGNSLTIDVIGNSTTAYDTQHSCSMYFSSSTDSTTNETTYTIRSTPFKVTRGEDYAKESHTHTVTHKPAGTISTPTFTGTEVTSSASSGTTSVYSITGVGSAPSLTASVTNRCLTLTFNAGSVPTRQSVTVPNTEHTHKITAAGTISQPTFTGTSATLTTSSTN